ncbi:conjugal transfer protein [Streptomyces sp. NRRL F-5630]|uniref:conjugal transfer protein n=1 Tax=Streptomyces sp. NRRL F-5630 TaxID=1463864 RepID=UPI003D7171F2
MSGQTQGEAGGWALGSLGTAATAVTVLRRGAWALLVCGGLALVLVVWLLVSGTRAPVVVRSVAPVASGGGAEAVGPAGFAELFISAYVSAGDGQEARLAPFLAGARDVDLSARPDVQRAQELAVVETRRVAEGYWSVTVAARVQPVGGGKKEQEAADALRYFRVAVKAGKEGALTAAGLPAEVSAPVASTAPVLGYGQAHLPGSDDPVARAVKGFFSAYLAAEGELDPYLSPGLELSAVSPAPYERATVSDLAEQSPGGAGATRRLWVRVAATDLSGQEWPLSYALTLRKRDGRWEVSALDAAPVLAKTSPASPEAGISAEEGR